MGKPLALKHLFITACARGMAKEMGFPQDKCGVRGPHVSGIGPGC